MQDAPTTISYNEVASCEEPASSFQGEATPLRALAGAYPVIDGLYRSAPFDPFIFTFLSEQECASLRAALQGYVDDAEPIHYANGLVVETVSKGWVLFRLSWGIDDLDDAVIASAARISPKGGGGGGSPLPILGDDPEAAISAEEPALRVVADVRRLIDDLGDRVAAVTATRSRERLVAVVELLATRGWRLGLHERASALSNGHAVAFADIEWVRQLLTNAPLGRLIVCAATKRIDIKPQATIHIFAPVDGRDCRVTVAPLGGGIVLKFDADHRTLRRSTYFRSERLGGVLEALSGGGRLDRMLFFGPAADLDKPPFTYAGGMH